MNTSQVIQYIVSGVTLGSVYAIVALGFTTIYNVTGIINFAQGEFVMLGGMLTYWLLRSAQLPIALSFILAILMVTIIGLLLERFAVRPAQKASLISLIIITIGASTFLRGIGGELWGRDAVPLPPISGEKPIGFLSAFVLPQHLWIIGIMVVLMVSLHLFLSYTLLGKAVRACAGNRYAAGLVGINVHVTSAFAFAVSAAFGAIAGIIVAPITLTSYSVGTMLGLKGFAAAVLGGLTSVPGAVLGGIALGLLESLGGGFVSSDYKDAIAFLVLFLVLFLRPQGMLGQRETKS